jgi:hypothetical protein
MEFRNPIGVPRTNFDVFVLFGLVSSVKQNLVRVVRLVEKPIFGWAGSINLDSGETLPIADNGRLAIVGC